MPVQLYYQKAVKIMFVIVCGVTRVKSVKYMAAASPTATTTVTASRMPTIVPVIMDGPAANAKEKCVSPNIQVSI